LRLPNKTRFPHQGVPQQTFERAAYNKPPVLDRRQLPFGHRAHNMDRFSSDLFEKNRAVGSVFLAPPDVIQVRAPVYSQ